MIRQLLQNKKHPTHVVQTLQAAFGRSLFSSSNYHAVGAEYWLISNRGDLEHLFENFCLFFQFSQPANR